MESCEGRQFRLCPRFEYTFSILGKKWTGLIIDVLLEEGPQRFKDIASKVVDVSDRVLVERLKELETNGIVTRNVYPEAPVRIEYELTKKGQDLRQVMSEIQKWGDKWYDLVDEAKSDEQSEIA